MADLKLTTPSRRATLLGAVAMASATVAVSGGAKASQISPALQKAFDEWQVLRAVAQRTDAALEDAHDRRRSITPECPADLLRSNMPANLRFDGHHGYVPVRFSDPSKDGWRITADGLREKLAELSGFSGENIKKKQQKIEALLPIAEAHEAALAASDEMSGVNAATEADDKAFNAKHEGFVRFTRIRPKTMADIQFQATHIVEWCDEGDSLEGFVFDWMKSLAQFVS